MSEQRDIQFRTMWAAAQRLYDVPVGGSLLFELPVEFPFRPFTIERLASMCVIAWGVGNWDISTSSRTIRLIRLPQAAVVRRGQR